MAKKKSEAAPPAGDAVMSRFLKARESRTNGSDNLLTAQQLTWRLGGLPLPSLSARMLFGQDALPLGRVFVLAGESRSYKSTFAVEVCRWFHHMEGLALYSDVEKKLSGSMVEAMLWHDVTAMDSLKIQSDVADQDEWQRAQSGWFMDIKKARGDSLVVPAIGVVDSWAAARPSSDMVKFEESGVGGRGFATTALSNARFMEQVTSYVAGGPSLMLVVQHITITPSEVPGRPAKVTYKGGGEITYAKSASLEFSASDKKSTATTGGATVFISNGKNAFGPSKLRVAVPLKWLFVTNPETGVRQQYTYFDWAESTIDQLLLLKETDGMKRVFDAVSDIVDIHPVSRRRVWSRALGVPSDQPVSRSQLGEILEYDYPQLLPPLYDVLNIQRRGVLAPGEDLKNVWEGRGANGVPAVVPYPRISHMLQQLAPEGGSDGDSGDDE